MQREAKRRRTMRRSVIVAVVAIVVIGSAALLFSGKGTPTTTTSTVLTPQMAADKKAVAAGCPAKTTTAANHDSWKSAPAMTINTAKTYDAHVTTTAGTFVIQLNAKAAPHTVNNFVFLAQHKYYDCVIFHRVIPGFVVQGGDPTGTGTGGPGYQFADELPKTGNPTYPLYSVAMANSGANTNGSQFFIVTGSQGEALPAKYSLFGQVVSGQSVVTKIQNEGTTVGTPAVTERMLSVTITEK